jgi:hypothetical protein
MDDITKAYDGRAQMIDTSTVRVHQHAAGKGMEIVPQSRRIDTCCRRCLGRPICLMLTAGKGDAPDFVEVGEAGIAVDDAMRRQRRVQLVG